MRKVAGNGRLLIAAMMASSLSYAEGEASKVSAENIAAMDGKFESIGELDSSFDAEMDIPIVLTAARLRQSQLDTPASVTVIESRTIEALGFKDIEEIFRLVPGMVVAYHSGVSEKTASVAYHGTNLPEHRRLQVLIDGRSVFKPGLARVEWADIPLAVEDIARIEVIRGPNSAAYGANSYLGVINIMTKHPQSEKGVVAKITGGMREVKNSYVNISDSTGSTEFRWTIGSKQKSGFDVLSDGGTDVNRDGIQANYTTVSTYTPLSSKSSIEWSAGYKTGLNEQRELHEGLIVYYSPEDIYADDIFLQTKVNYDYNPSQSAHLQVYSQKFIRETAFYACESQGVANIFTNGVIVCGDFNKDLTETKSEIEYQHTSLWSNSLRTVSGVRLRLDEFESETYNAGHTDNLNTSIFVNAEYRLDSQFLLNAGGMYEKDDLNGDYFSPRIALNTHITSTDTIRLIYSEAIRAPDLFEQGGQWVFTVRNAVQEDGSTYNNGVVDLPAGTVESHVDFEKIKSTEISYFGLYPNLHAQLDIKIFIDELSGLISESLGKDVELTNSNRLRQKGIEGQFKIKLNEANDLALSFSYLDNQDDFAENMENGELTLGAKRESSLTAERSGSVSWVHTYSQRNTLGMAYYHVENWNEYADTDGDGFNFSRLDLNIIHHLPLNNGSDLAIQGTVQYRLDDDPLGRPKNNYLDDHFVFASVKYSF